MKFLLGSDLKAGQAGQQNSQFALCALSTAHSSTAPAFCTVTRSSSGPSAIYRKIPARRLCPPSTQDYQTGWGLRAPLHFILYCTCPSELVTNSNHSVWLCCITVRSWDIFCMILKRGDTSLAGWSPQRHASEGQA